MKFTLLIISTSCQQNIHCTAAESSLSLLYTEICTRQVAPAPKKLFLPSPFFFSSSMKAANKGTAISSGSLLLSVMQEQPKVQALISALCWLLCTHWLDLLMFKTLTGNILFCWITYQTTLQWNFQGLRNCAWRYLRGLVDSFSSTAQKSPEWVFYSTSDSRWVTHVARWRMP